MTLSIACARLLLQLHGFTLDGFPGHYRIRRYHPGVSCPKDKLFYRDWCSFHASSVSSRWVRRLADALAMADASAVTFDDCTDARAASRKAVDSPKTSGGSMLVANLVVRVLREELLKADRAAAGL